MGLLDLGVQGYCLDLASPHVQLQKGLLLGVGISRFFAGFGCCEGCLQDPGGVAGFLDLGGLRV